MRQLQYVSALASQTELVAVSPYDTVPLSSVDRQSRGQMRLWEEGRGPSSETTATTLGSLVGRLSLRGMTEWTAG
jgi:hypothetical protein